MQAARPLALGVEGQHLEEVPSRQSLTKKRIFVHRCIFCIILSITAKIFLGVLVLIFIFTVFRIREPKIRLNSVVIDTVNLNILTGTISISAKADVAVKNPNVVTFIYKNTTTSVIYHDRTVGNVTTPSGKAKARRTVHMNVTLIITIDELAADEAFRNDLAFDVLPLTTFTRLKGKINVLFEKHVKLTLMCNFNISVSTQTILSQYCEQKMKM